MRKSIIFTLMILCTIRVSAENYYGKRIGIENGLSQSFITAVTYDNSGSLWIGTKNGLNEYRNGVVRNIPGILGKTYVTDILCDSLSRLWVATEKGVWEYDRTNDSFTVVSESFANCLHESNGHLYIGGTKSKRKDIIEICSYKDSIIYIGKNTGISIEGADSTGHFLDIPEIEGKTVSTASLINNRLAVSLQGEGLLLYNIDTHTSEGLFRPCGNGDGRELIISQQIIDGKLWLGTDGDGIMILDPESGKIQSFSEVNSLLPGTEIPASVTSIFQDPVGNIWVGGVYSGVIGLKPTAIRTYLPDEIINTVYFSGDNRLYIGSDGDGISILDGEDRAPRKALSTAGMKITSICDYDSRRLIFCAFNKGLYLLDRQSLEITPFTLINKDITRQECLYGAAPEVCTLGNGKIMIFALHNYLHDPARGTFESVKVAGDQVAKELRTVAGKGHDRFTYTWTGVFDIQQGGVLLQRRLYENRESGYIYALSCSDDKLFYGTGHGLFSVDLANGEKSQIQTPLFTRVTGLCCDNAGQLWIGADNALFLYKNGAFELIGEDYGVQANEYICGTVAWDGTVYLGGTNGLLSIHNAEILSEKSGEKVVHLHNVSVNGKSQLSESGSISVSHNYENINLSIALYGFDPLERVAYKYTVNGLNSYTVETFDDNLQLPTLKAGKYSVNVSYMMNGGLWSTPQTVLDIKVLRPWYGSAAMCCVYAILALAALAAGAVYEKKRIIKNLQAKARDTEFLNAFTRYVEEHISDNTLNVEKIAEAFGMSRATLYAKVKDSIDTGIGEYIDGKRLELAKQLLKTSNLTVTEISERTGFSTPRYFCTRFKLLTGETPLSFRNNSTAI